MRAHDGMLIGTGDGSMFRVFDPPWWRVDRWARWYAARAWERLLGKPVGYGLAKLNDASGSRVVRVVADPIVLANVPRRRR